MNVQRFLKFFGDLLYFPVYWYVDNLAFWFKFITRSLILIFDGLSFGAVLKNFFQPYRQDRTPVGYGVGIVIRLFWLVAGLGIGLAFTAVLLVAFVAYLLLPVVLLILILNPEIIDKSEWIGSALSPLAGGNGLLWLLLVWLLIRVTAFLIFDCLVYWYFQKYAVQPHKLLEEFRLLNDKQDLSWDEAENLEQSMSPVARRIWQKISPLPYSAYLLMEQFFIYHKTANSLQRLNLNKDQVLDALEKSDASLNREQWLKVLKESLTFGLTEQHSRLDTELLFLGLVKADIKVADVFKKLGFNFDDLKQVTAWMEEREIKEKSWQFWDDRFFKRAQGVDLGWVSGFTPVLKTFTTDITKAASRGSLPQVFGRDKEIEEVLDILSAANRNNVLIVGPAGVGKSSIVYGIAQRMLRGDKEIAQKEKIVGKKILSLDTGGLLAGTSGRGDLEERVTRALEEIKGGNIILMIDEIHALMKAGVADFLSPTLSLGQIQVIGTTTPEDYKETIENNQTFASYFQIVRLEEPSEEESLKILEGVVPRLEQEHGVTISYPALEAAVKLSKRFVHDRSLPSKAIELIDEAATRKSKIKNQKSKIKEERILTAEDIAGLLSEKIRVPLEKLSGEESEKLLNLEKILQERIIGQDKAVVAVANALRRARSGMASGKRPIGSFLFLGPTGVGKTETAKVLSETYFGSQTEMIRFDMTEFSEHGSVNRFLDRLCDQVRSRPFAVLLVDEFEKAEGDIHNLFLQIMDDGRLTDLKGRTVDFTNTFVIATSNSQDIHKDFRPELLNRFDGIIQFNQLTPEDVVKIARLLLNQVVKQMKEKEIEIEFSDEVVKKIAELGFDPNWGARPLRRVIQEKIENKLAEMLLKKELQSGQKMVFDIGLLS